VPRADGGAKKRRKKRSVSLLRAVVDTNIFVSGIINPAGPPGQVIKALRDGAFTLVSSSEINEEILEVLSRPRLQKYHLQNALFDIGVILYTQAELVQAKVLVKASPDPEDDKVLTAALGGKAQYVVTGDKTGLLQLEEYQGVHIITAKIFLHLLEDSPPE
jgi:hypothetical protein